MSVKKVKRENPDVRNEDATIFYIEKFYPGTSLYESQEALEHFGDEYGYLLPKKQRSIEKTCTDINGYVVRQADEGRPRLFVSYTLREEGLMLLQELQPLAILSNSPFRQVVIDLEKGKIYIAKKDGIKRTQQARTWLAQNKLRVTV